MSLNTVNPIHRLLLAGALGATALALWLLGGPAGHAASATQTQATAAAVPTTISWGTAGACTQSMGTADFGSVSAGSSAESGAVTPFRGCVTSNATWAVSAIGTGTLTSGSDTIDNSNLVIRTIATGLPTGGTTSCNDTNTTCTMDASRSVISGAAKTAKAFDYKYLLSVPSAAAAGTYTGGQVTFTASN